MRLGFWRHEDRALAGHHSAEETRQPTDRRGGLYRAQFSLIRRPSSYAGMYVATGRVTWRTGEFRRSVRLPVGTESDRGVRTGRAGLIFIALACILYLLV